MYDILSEEKFGEIIKEERYRADRYYSVFSLIVFDFDMYDGLPEKIDQIARTIQRRKRQIDRFGWIGYRQLGLILPHTPQSGAEKLARYLSHDLVWDQVRPGVRIFSYPLDWLPEFFKNDKNSDAVKPKKPDDRTTVHSKPNNTNVTDSVESLSTLFFSVYPPSLPRWKRHFDLIFSILFLFMFFPVMVLTALYIKTISAGPVFFKQERIGYLGKPFLLWKFRTMKMFSKTNQHHQHVSRLIHSEESMTKLDEKNDPRIIPMGRFLRNFGIDELPQIFNVIRGEMSLIGPRPALAYEVKEYQSWHNKRLEVLPGLTGLWQVSGKNETTFKKMVRLDIDYSRRMSICRDLKIMFLTIPALLSQGFALINNRKTNDYAKKH